MPRHQHEVTVPKVTVVPTPIEPDEIRLNRFTRQPVVNTTEVNRLVEARLTPAQREEQSRGRMTLDGMEQALRPLREREMDRENSVRTLTGDVARRQEQVRELRERWEHAEASSQAHLVGARVDAMHLARKLKYAEQDLAAWTVRLETSTKILDAIKAGILEWLRANGKTLQDMRKLKYTPR
jgi:hypothetical protein